ncbi:hypothetical protein CHS0354_020680 [Potamilus streckersoni]|uniref:Temptin n=1 Tax=Potamilus streckersoni TaxID=2493646 RepID=A0AAE0SET1_9BIVA|nr:hypothetical protein CHS0354_020680 [Potamilus streckersoni]
MEEICKRICSLFVLLLWLMHFVGCYQIFQDLIPNGNIVPHPCKANYIWRGVGHLNPLGGGQRNPFGLAFHAAGNQWTTSLCQQDSDGDGRTNGEELGDRDCVWSQGQAPSISIGLSHPGVCEPMDSPTCAAINTWVDCTLDKFRCDAINNIDTMTLEVRMPATPVPAKETTYMCMVFDLPKDGDFHLIAFEALQDNLNVLHHIVVYGCDERSKNYIVNHSEECFMSAQEGCEDIVAVWTLGLPGICYHDNIGIRIGTNGYKRAVMELHWNNPKRIAGTTDRSGVKLFYTSKLRPNDAGILMIGQTSLRIPPGKNTFAITGSCPGDCTNKLMVGNIHVVTAFNHMHYLGLQERFQLLRNGSKLQDLAYDSFYSYDSPVIYNFPNPVEVWPGDELTTTCIFKSTSRSKTTFFGLETSDEMCYSFIMYYPEKNALNKECTQWEDISTCDIDTDRNGTIRGCPTHTIFDISIPQHADIYHAVTENCDITGIYCREECKSVVKSIRKHPCFNGSVDKWIRTHLADLPIPDVPVNIRDFYSALDSCDVEFLVAKFLDNCEISGDETSVRSSTGTVWSLRSLALIVACVVRKNI